MHNQFLALLRNEASKALQRRLPYFGLFGVGLVSVLVYFIAGRLSNAASANAWGYTAFSMQLLFTDIGPIFVIVFSALLLSEETGTGTIRSVLAAPVQRWELYLAKCAIGILYMLVLSAAAVLFSIALAKIHYDFGPVKDAFGVVYSREKALREFLLGYALSWIPLCALVVYGLFISTIVRQPGAAVAVGTSTLLIIDLTKHLVGLDPYIFTKYIGYSWLTLQQLSQGMDYQWQPEVWRMAALSSAYIVVILGTGLTLFVKEDLNH